MNKFALFLFCVTIVLVGCNKEIDLSNKFILKITSNEKGIDEIRVFAYLPDGTKTIIGRGKPSENGYTVYIDDPLNPMYLYKIGGAADFLHAPQVSDPDVLCYNSVFYFNAYRNNRSIGTFSNTKHIIGGEDQDIESEYYCVKYIYVTEDVSITGTKNTDWGESFQTFDLHFKKGWNAYVQIDYFHTSHTGYTESVFTSDIPTGLTWKLS